VILKEGALPLVLTATASAVVWAGYGVLAASPLLTLIVAMGWLYWERRPPLPSEPKTIVAPVRGRVVAVGPERDPWLDREALRVRIRVALPGIVPLRGPIEGKIMDLFTARGMFGSQLRACTGSESPDCYASWIRTDEGEDVVYAISSAWPVSRARFEQSPGERVGHGKRSGFVYFATVVDVLVPNNARARIAVGEAAVAGVSLLAQMPRQWLGP
jgi:phosphatidylserine decarboxylase